MLKKIFLNIKKSERVFTGLRFKMSDSSGEKTNSSNLKNDPLSTQNEKDDETAANNSNTTTTDSSKKEKALDESNLTDYFNTDMIDLLSSMLGYKWRMKDENELMKLKKLETLDLNGVAKYLKTCKNIIFMTGAGISTAAGIPDFRSPKTGLYQNLEKYNLPYPEAIFDIHYFRESPKPFFTLSKELMPQNYKPTISHYFQRLLIEKGQVLRVYSQNIDALETIANIPDEKVIHAHGSFKTGHCLGCRKEYTLEWMKSKIHQHEFLRCESEECSKKSDDYIKIIKPDITFFGESLPESFMTYTKDFPQCDLLIVMGTSLKVQPFGSIAGYVKDDCPRLLINRDLVSDWEYYEEYPDKNYRDVAFQGDCDEGCLKLAELIGLKEELLDLVKKDHERLDKLSNSENQK